MECGSNGRIIPLFLFALSSALSAAWIPVIDQYQDSIWINMELSSILSCRKFLSNLEIQLVQ